MKKILIALLVLPLLIGCTKKSYNADQFSVDDFKKISVGSKNKELKKMMVDLHNSIFCPYDECYEIDLNLTATVWVELGFEGDVVKSKQLYVYSPTDKEIKKYFTETTIESLLALEFDISSKEVEKQIGKGFISFEAESRKDYDYYVNGSIMSLEFQEDKLVRISNKSYNFVEFDNVRIANQLKPNMTIKDVEAIFGGELSIQSISSRSIDYIVSFGEFNSVYMSFFNDKLAFMFSMLDATLLPEVKGELVLQVKSGMTLNEVEGILGEGILTELNGLLGTVESTYSYQVDNKTVSIDYLNGEVTNINRED